MTYLLLAFLGVVLMPLLVATWRTSLLGLALQGLLMAAMLAARGWPTSASGVVLFADLLLVRTYLAPRYLYAVLRAQNAPRRSDVLPANLLSWAAAGGFVFVAFQFAALVSPEGGEEAMVIAVAAAALLVAFLVLATQRRTFGLVAGALGLENAIALFELSAGHPLPLPVQLGVTSVLVLTVLTFGAFVRRMPAEPAPPGPREGEAPAAAAGGGTP